MQITTTYGCLRAWKLGDETELARQADNIKIWLNLRDRFPHPYTIEDAVSYIEMNVQSEKIYNFAIVVNGSVAGSIGYIPQSDIYSHTAEVGYWIGEQYWGRGIATEALTVFINYLWANTQLHKLFACTFAHNTASMKVLEKCGFTHEAILKQQVMKNAQFIDEHRFALFRKQFAS